VKKEKKLIRRERRKEGKRRIEIWEVGREEGVVGNLEIAC
jgi:hypothetical protein